jgi:hypothetical protein
MRFAFLIALGALLSACAGLERDPGAATVALRLPGFTATAPAARGWIMTPGTATAQAAVRSVGDNRTLVAFASEEDLRELAGAQSGGALDKALAEIRRSYESGRHRLRSFEQGDADEGCREYRLTAEDSSVPDRAGRLYVVTALGKVCVLPERNLVARLEYSDRRVEDEPPLPAFEQEAGAFLDSLSVAGG